MNPVIGHQMEQRNELVILTDMKKTMPEWGIELWSFAIRTSIVALDHQDT